MSTIKIDRGFTQKIQAKGLVHNGISPSPEPPRKKPAGGRKALLFALLGGVVLSVAVAVAVAGASKKKKPLRKVAVPAAAAPSAAAVKPVKESDAVEPEEPAETRELYEKGPPPATVSAQPAKPPSRPVFREVPVGSPSGVLCEYFDNITERSIQGFCANKAFPGQPSRTVQFGRFELSDNIGDNYGARVRALLAPERSGRYTFTVVADDMAELWLSADETPSKAKKIVAVTSWTSSWDQRGEQHSEPVELQGGKRYYIEALMKENNGSDRLAVGWSGPVSEKTVVIDGAYVRPWSEDELRGTGGAAAREAGRLAARASREARIAPARKAVAEQMSLNGTACRYQEAAQKLKDGLSGWSDPEAQEIVETAIQRFELLGRLKSHVQSDLAKARLKGVWVAFGGQADVTDASDEGVTVAPGRIVAWEKIPRDQMLRLLGAVLARTSVEPAAKSSLLLAAAVFCKEIAAHTELTLKYRESAVAHHAPSAALADRLLEGSPEAILARPRVEASRDELARLASAALAHADQVGQLRRELASVKSAPAGEMLVEYWDNVTVKSLDELRDQGITTKRPPDATRRVSDFTMPDDRADHYVARLKAFLTPPESGDYYFYIAADDQAEFWLGSESDHNKTKLCVKVDAAVGRKQWDRDKLRSAAIRLEKGRRYAVKGLLRESEKSDHFAVAWSLAADDKPVPIPAGCLSGAGSSSTSGPPDEAGGERKRIEAALLQLQGLVDGIVEAREADAEREEARAALSKPMADELAEQVRRAGEALKRIESGLQEAVAALARLNGA